MQAYKARVCATFTHFTFGNYPDRAKEFRRLERAAWRVPDQLVTVSDHQQEGVRRLYGIKKTRVKTLWNGVDVLPAVEPVKEIARFREEGRTIIGSVNTLIEQKGMPDLIKVAKLLKSQNASPFVFLIAGGGPLLDRLESQCSRTGARERGCIHGLGGDGAAIRYSVYRHILSAVALGGNVHCLA